MEETTPVPELSKKELKAQKKAALKKVHALQKARKHLEVTNLCRNCETSLDLDQRFCPSCGAKRMHNRLNLRNLVEDFTDRFLNVEAQLPRTFVALFTRPEEVVNGYINGVRKKYLSAFSYFAIYLTIAGIYTFIFKNFLFDKLINEQSNLNPGNPIDQQVGELIIDFVNKFNDYQAFFTFLLLPLLALLSKLVFYNYKKYNYIEHLVIYLYLYSHVQILISLGGILFAWSSTLQMITSIILSILYLLYLVYALKRIFDLTPEQILLKTLLFACIGVFLIIITALAGGIIFGMMYKAGDLDDVEMINSFKNLMEQQKALREAAKATRDSIKLDSIKHIKEAVIDTLNLPSLKKAIIDNVK